METAFLTGHGRTEPENTSYDKRLETMLCGRQDEEGGGAENQEIGEWRVYDARGRLIKITQHKSKIGEP